MNIYPLLIFKQIKPLVSFYSSTCRSKRVLKKLPSPDYERRITSMSGQPQEESYNEDNNGLTEEQEEYWSIDYPCINLHKT